MVALVFLGIRNCAVWIVLVWCVVLGSKGGGYKYRYKVCVAFELERKSYCVWSLSLIISDDIVHVVHPRYLYIHKLTKSILRETARKTHDPHISVWTLWRAAKELLEPALALKLLNLALQNVYPVVLERLLNSLSTRRILCDRSRCRCSTCQQPNLASNKETTNRKEKISRCVTPSWWREFGRDIRDGLCNWWR